MCLFLNLEDNFLLILIFQKVTLYFSNLALDFVLSLLKATSICDIE